MKHKELEDPRLSINKEIFSQVKAIAQDYGRSLAQLVINWNFSQKGITSAIVGTRNLVQLKDNLLSVGWKISQQDTLRIEELLKERADRIKRSESSER